MRAGGKQGRERASGCRRGDALRDPLFWAGSRARDPTPAPTAPGSVPPPQPAATAETLLCPVLGTGLSMAAAMRDLAPAAGLASDSTAALLPAIWGSGPAGSHVQPAGFSPPKPLCPALPGPWHTRAAVPTQGYEPRGRGDSGWSTMVSSAEGCCSRANR